MVIVPAQVFALSTRGMVNRSSSFAPCLVALVMAACGGRSVDATEKQDPLDDGANTLSSAVSPDAAPSAPSGGITPSNVTPSNVTPTSMTLSVEPGNVPGVQEEPMGRDPITEGIDPELPASDCLPPSQIEVVDVPVIYGFSDDRTTYELVPTPDGAGVCISGEADSAGEYLYWGAGFGLRLQSEAEPFDAAALGIGGFEFTLSEVANRPVQVRAMEVNRPEIAEDEYNFESNAYYWGGSSPKQLQEDAVYIVPFEALALPRFTLLASEYVGVLDTSRLHSLQFMVPNYPNDSLVQYKFCISNLRWLDTCGQVVALTPALPDVFDNGRHTGGEDSTDSMSDTVNAPVADVTDTQESSAEDAAVADPSDAGTPRAVVSDAAQP